MFPDSRQASHPVFLFFLVDFRQTGDPQDNMRKGETRDPEPGHYRDGPGSGNHSQRRPEIKTMVRTIILISGGSPVTDKMTRVIFSPTGEKGCKKNPS